MNKSDLRVINCKKKTNKPTQVEKMLASVTSNQELKKKRNERKERLYNQKYTQLSLFQE